MKKQNKCFFSISLENGITLTSRSVTEMLDFLYDLHSAFFSLSEYHRKNGNSNLEENACWIMTSVGNAIKMIKNNQD